MMRTLARTLALAMALFVFVPSAVPRQALAQDAPSDPGFRLYAAEARKILKTAGNKVWEAAEKAKRSGFWQYAYEQAQRAIKFDPRQADAREHLGYVKSGKKWVLDEEAAAKLKKNNVRGGANGVQEGVESFNKRVEKWKEEVLAKANKFVAARYVKLGAVCAKKGFPLQANKGYEYALRLDPENSAARKGLGYKKMGKVWITGAQEKAIKDAGKSTELKEESRWDTEFGVKLVKAETTHIRIEGVLDLADVKEIAETSEMAYALYLADLGRDPTDDFFGGKKARLVFMEEGDQWKKWVDAFGGGEFALKNSGFGSHVGLQYGKKLGAGSDQVLRKDGAVHTLVHMLNLKVLNIQGGAWINEGLAYYYSVKVQETCRTHCVGIKKDARYGKETASGGIKDWNDASNWKPNVLELVKSKADIELRELVLKPVEELEFEATVKSWSIISWMMDTDRDKFIELVGELGGQDKHVGILEAWWGDGCEEIDKQWREYVLRNY